MKKPLISAFIALSLMISCDSDIPGPCDDLSQNVESRTDEVEITVSGLDVPSGFNVSLSTKTHAPYLKYLKKSFDGNSYNLTIDYAEPGERYYIGVVVCSAPAGEEDEQFPYHIRIEQGDNVFEDDVETGEDIIFELE